MVETFNVSKTIALPSDKAWPAIYQIDGLERDLLSSTTAHQI